MKYSRWYDKAAEDVFFFFFVSINFFLSEESWYAPKQGLAAFFISSRILQYSHLWVCHVCGLTPQSPTDNLIISIICCAFYSHQPPSTPLSTTRLHACCRKIDLKHKSFLRDVVNPGIRGWDLRLHRYTEDNIHIWVKIINPTNLLLILFISNTLNEYCKQKEKDYRPIRRVGLSRMWVKKTINQTIINNGPATANGCKIDTFKSNEMAIQHKILKRLMLCLMLPTPARQHLLAELQPHSLSTAASSPTQLTSVHSFTCGAPSRRYNMNHSYCASLAGCVPLSETPMSISTVKIVHQQRQ